MPQLDQFTYFSQFLWLCLCFFAFYVLICNDGDGILGISRILKLRNQLIGQRGAGKPIESKHSSEDLLQKGLSTGVSYMYDSLSEVSDWCRAVNSLVPKRKSTLISCFGEISGSRGMERNILSNLSKSTAFNTGRWMTCTNCRNELMVIHLVHGQVSIK